MTNNGEENGPVMIDTSIWIESLRENGRAEVKNRLHDLLKSGRAGWCEMVRLELWRGVRGASEFAKLEALDGVVKNFSTDPRAWAESMRLCKAALANGQRPPPADVVIAATARRYQLPLEHLDRHLAALIKIG